MNIDLGLDEFLFGLLKQYWYWIVLALLIKVFFDLILPDLINNWKFKKTLAWSSDQERLRELRKLSPEEFEIFIVNLFNKLGYHAIHNGRTGDHGIDAILEKNGKRTYVQCKRYSSKHKVGEPEIRNFLGALVDKKVETSGLFITTGFFTNAAERFAEDKPIELINGFVLLKYIHDVESKSKSVNDEEDSNLCPSCKIGELVEKKGKYGDFMGCSRFPDCSYTASKS